MTIAYWAAVRFSIANCFDRNLWEYTEFFVHLGEFFHTFSVCLSLSSCIPHRFQFSSNCVLPAEDLWFITGESPNNPAYFTMTLYRYKIVNIHTHLFLLDRVGGRVVRWCWVNFQCRGVLQSGLQ